MVPPSFYLATPCPPFVLCVGIILCSLLSQTLPAHSLCREGLCTCSFFLTLEHRSSSFLELAIPHSVFSSSLNCDQWKFFWQNCIKLQFPALCMVRQAREQSWLSRGLLLSLMRGRYRHLTPCTFYLFLFKITFSSLRLPALFFFNSRFFFI
jgi:hypothetical protein